MFATCCLLSLHSFSQSNYGVTGSIESTYKDQYTFTCKLDEKTHTLSFETNAPVSVVTLETYTPEELAVRKGKEYTDMYFKKSGNKYTYDLKQPLLKDQYAYWLKVSTGNNGAPLAEYFFRKTTAVAPSATTENTKPTEETKNAAGATIIQTNIKCTTGKTKVIAALKEMDGVSSVKIDITTGKLTIVYSSDGTPYNEILNTINENGFDAGGQKSTRSNSNPCKKKTVN